MIHRLAAVPVIRFGDRCQFLSVQDVRNIRRFQKLAVMLFGSTLAGCATLPSSGPTSSAVIRGARINAEMPYTVVDITPQVIKALPPTQSLGVAQMGILSSNAKRGRADMIRDGDTLSILVFEVGVGLFSGQANADIIRAPTAGAQQIVAVVREGGNVDLPYLGTVRAAGIYPEKLAEELRRRLKIVSESPQVIVNIADTAHNVVYISGAIAKPGRYRLTAAHEKLLDMLAIAGGPADNPNNVEIKIVRGSQVAQAPLNEISSEELANLELMPDDRVEVVLRRPSYTVFGATDKVSQISLDANSVNLAEATARAAGPSDSRANPRGVFVFRLEKGPNDEQPRAVVYRLNMLKPESYFLAQMFAVKDKDVILFSNSSSNLTQKLATLITQLINPVLPALFLLR
ncbi:MAG: hypothetical protein B7Y43_11595 [Sphingomonas sp. 28-62-20]|uniref:polysaccharide biosynthesis/export family protein n=1 Tax=Sphingomonas sp. 28-62-20 TaxID=1970433 RepID=UPI000BD1952A|nr:MAG: hypothetical protein B7Y43_11595 [Sphingomonas sp. 28-62-20]